MIFGRKSGPVESDPNILSKRFVVEKLYSPSFFDMDPRIWVSIPKMIRDRFLTSDQ